MIPLQHLHDHPDFAEPTTAPVSKRRIGDVIARNLEFEVDPRVECIVRVGGFIAEYTAWNFIGYVWHDGAYKCEVWVHHEPREVVEAETMEELMRVASERYGFD